MPAQYNFLGDARIWRGNTRTITFRFKNADSTPVDLTGSTLEFRAVNAAGQEIVKRNLTVAAPSTGEASIVLTVSETAAFTEGQRNRYEVERRISSTEETLIYGTITAEGGINTNV